MITGEPLDYMITIHHFAYVCTDFSRMETPIVCFNFQVSTNVASLQPHVDARSLPRVMLLSDS